MTSAERAAEPFRFGRRQIVSYNQTAQPTYTWLPLQPDDFLAVKPGDDFEQGPRHAADVAALRRTLRWHHRYSPFLTVLGGLPINIPSIVARPAPDLFIVANLADSQRPRTHYDVTKEGDVGGATGDALPTFILEVTSPLLARYDLETKLALYAQAGVQEYFILDSGAPDEPSPIYRWHAYTLRGASYDPIPTTETSEIHSAVNRAAFGVTQDRAGFYVRELRTGQLIVPDSSFEDQPIAVQSEAAARALALSMQLAGMTGNQKP